ncbi:MAG: DUF1549 domain-containing protein, partial [Gemmatimonadetes bacterium]|nr:DUF1549 domain-containing protein [Gemmatimonadota bacterium]
MWPWRDWVINAFNRNMPFDPFTIEQLAGDLLPDAGLAQRIATGFNRNHMVNFEGGAIPQEYQTEYVIDRVIPSGEAGEITREQVPVRLGAQERAEWEDRARGRASHLPIPEVKPFIREIVVDEHGFEVDVAELETIERDAEPGHVTGHLNVPKGFNVASASIVLIAALDQPSPTPPPFFSTLDIPGTLMGKGNVVKFDRAEFLVEARGLPQRRVERWQDDAIPLVHQELLQSAHLDVLGVGIPGPVLLGEVVVDDTRLEHPEVAV